MGALTTTLLVASSLASAGSSLAQGRGMRNAANFATDQARRQAEDAIARGEEDVTRYKQDVAQLLGQQRTAIAASGVDVTSGTAADLRAQTERFADMDVATIRRNAEREAFGIRASGQMQAQGLRNQAAGAFMNAGSTLLTTGIDAWQTWGGGPASRAMRRTSNTIRRDLAAWG